MYYATDVPSRGFPDGLAGTTLRMPVAAGDGEARFDHTGRAGCECV